MKTLPYNFRQQHNPNFNASMLKIGEMMELFEQHPGEIVLRTYDNIVLLSNPKCTWGTNAPLQGRKLLPGEGIALIQE